MRVDPRSGWRSGGTASDGRELQFDSPKCLFRYRMERGGVRRPWVIEYYAQQRRNAEGLFYVEGSDLAGPMGPDLVPVHEHAAAERFSSDHHGRRVLAYRDVSRAVVDSLFRPNN